ncbi:MAG: hypothetical protein JW863_09775 [Chitinispirillaceae bacterium]|nr:hypothetical protein [Chitinispirillaceae bacterium]
MIGVIDIKVVGSDNNHVTAGPSVGQDFPRDGKYVTLTFPVARFNQLSWKKLVAERDISFRTFYSYTRILYRVLRSIRYRMNPAVVLISNCIIRVNTGHLDHRAYAGFNLTMDRAENGARAVVVKSVHREHAADAHTDYSRQTNLMHGSIGIMQ